MIENAFGKVELSKVDFFSLSREELEKRAQLLSTILQNMTVAWERIRVESRPEVTMRLALDETLFMDEEELINLIQKIFTEEDELKGKS